jgi:hypothetical protein
MNPHLPWASHVDNRMIPTFGLSHRPKVLLFLFHYVFRLVKAQAIKVDVGLFPESYQIMSIGCWLTLD